MKNKRSQWCLAAFVVALLLSIVLKAVAPETCYAARNAGVADSSSEMWQVENVVNGFIKLELGGTGDTRYSHLWYYGDLYTEFTNEQIASYDDIAIVNDFRIVNISQSHAGAEFVVKVKIGLLAILVRESPGMHDKKHSKYSRGMYVNQYGHNEDPRIEYKSEKRCGGIWKIIEPHGYDYYFDMRVKKCKVGWRIDNSMSWREMRGGSNEHINSNLDRISTELQNRIDSIRILQEKKQKEDNVQIINSINAELICQENHYKSLNGELDCERILLNMQNALDFHLKNGGISHAKSK